MSKPLPASEPAAPRSPERASESEAAEYIASLLVELEKIARGHRLVALQYKLREAHEEATRAALVA